ncbi:hypothetical protein [Limnospira platensis]|uniref:hypothetical protein n=1 Tax=Limnospira platensis TaxID=118562 RepID=UPI0001D0EE34|nr:hypothetical protein APPUASWS_024090 [Arthrospira platensis str. Paraca]MDF2208118.1 hypothetical protein [Arthrospira platensis NCB002]QQW30777.1 hypothetical protein AP9108_09070 [Arthrospira sp. PCC 9108]BAI93608.1 hypothetical protein NIES39_O03600 [Arthrospira platensis NIES-39]BDT15824.1 hypothetical protein N39L_55470 [Arthrospira platensis NIES-39]
MKGIKNMATEINASNWHNAVELFNGAILEGLITDRCRYDITAYAYVSSLNARCYIPSLNQSKIPKIYPEYSYYQRWEKKQDV